MSPQKVRLSPGQEAFPIEGMAPSIPLDTDPIDWSADGVSTDLVEGWRVMHRVLNEISRARSNSQGFATLPASNERVKDFANQIDETPEEAKRKVAATGGYRRSGGTNPTHYEKGQLRIFDYHNKQVARARDDKRIPLIGDPALITQSLPMDIGAIENKFYSGTPKEQRQKALNRKRMASFVKKHS